MKIKDQLNKIETKSFKKKNVFFIIF